MKEVVLITGARGSLAKTLKMQLSLQYQLHFLTTKTKNHLNNEFYWNISTNEVDSKAFYGVQHIIHLAGFSISKLWTAKNKKIMYDSRVKSSHLLFKYCQKLNISLKTFISASAMGYYGFGNQKKTEEDPPANNWLGKMAVDWEEAANQFKVLHTRVIILRLSVLITHMSGILPISTLSFKFGIGIIFGKGKQQMPWIHIEDASQFILLALQQNTIKGVFNLANPQKTSYKQFIKAIQTIKPISILFSIPQKLVPLLLQQKACLVLNNISLSTKRLQHTGFQWKYPSIQAAVKKELNP